MSVGISMNLCCMTFFLILSILYFSKKKINNDENRIYTWLLICNFIALLAEIVLFLTISFFPNSLFFIYFAERVYFAYILLWIMVFCYYIWIVTSYQNELFSKIIKEKHNQFIRWLIIIGIFLILLMLLLPVKHVYVGNQIQYAYGLAPNFMAFIGLIFILLSILAIILNYHNLNRKKILPFYLFIILLMLCFFIRYLSPSILLVTTVMTLISFLMYHTIENPDVKMIEALNEAKISAEKANRAKTDFLSSMSHEIRTPLNAIVGFSDCILEENNLEDAKNDAQDIKLASENLLEIVNGILDISKIEANKMEVVESNYEPLSLFENVAKLVKPRIGDKPILFETRFAHDIPYLLYGDSGKIKQVLTNILTNACKYTESGRIIFFVNCINDGDCCKIILSVEDTGRGIKPEQMNRLFTKFERLEEDRNTTLEGTGLGLAITKKLVELIGGKIVVQSKYGEGSKFTVYLQQKIIQKIKLEENILLESQLINRQDAVSYSSKKVLVVDDNKINIKVALKLLGNYGIQADSCESGFVCIEKIQNGENYDLILLDDMMPKMSGVETLQKLNELPNFSIPVVALTANAITGMREQYLNSGFEDYLAKPIEKSELERVLNTFLNNNKK